ncbi:MAG: hypothetical protein LC130_16815 [Bryobacterales bacterium]|nr:hypothetical protein [Bryobacterales bacterium]
MISLSVHPGALRAQATWQSNGSGVIYAPAGVNVGIGTASPGASFVVKTDAVDNGAFFGSTVTNGRANTRIYGDDGFAAGFLGNNYFDGAVLRRVHAGGGRGIDN